MSENSSSEKKLYPSIDLVFEETRRRIDSQLDRSKQLEGKANILTAFAGLATPNLASLQIDGQLFFWGVLSAATTLILGFLALMPAGHEMGIDPAWTRDHLLMQQPEKAKLKIVDGMLDQIADNHRMLNRKAWLVVWELVSFAFFIVLITTAKLASPPDITKVQIVTPSSSPPFAVEVIPLTPSASPVIHPTVTPRKLSSSHTPARPHSNKQRYHASVTYPEQAKDNRRH